MKDVFSGDTDYGFYESKFDKLTIKGSGVLVDFFEAGSDRRKPSDSSIWFSNRAVIKRFKEATIEEYRAKIKN